MTEAEEFEFRARIEAEQAAPPVPQETSLGEKAIEVGRSVPRGLAKAVDFFSGVVGEPDLSGIPPEQQIAMTPQDYAQLPQQPAFGKIMDSELGQSLLGKRVESGLEGNRGMDALVTGGDFGGSMLLPFGGAKKGQQFTQYMGKLAKEAGIFGGGAAAGDYAFDNELAALGTGLLASTRGVGIPAAAGRVKKVFSESAQAKEAARIIDEIALDAPAAKALLKTKLAAGEKGTVGQLTGDRGILEMEKAFAAKYPTFKGGLDAKNEEITKFALGKIDETVPTGADIQAPLDAAKKRVSGALEKVGEIAEEGQKRTLNKALAQQSSVGREAALTTATQKQGLDEALTAMETGGKNFQMKANIDDLNAAAPEGVKISRAGQGGITDLGEGIGKKYGEAWTGVKTIPDETLVSFNAAANKGLTGAGDEFTQNTIKNLQKQLTEVSKAATPEKIKEFDVLLRNQIRSAATGERLQPQLVDSLNDMRKALRKGFPEEVTTKLKALDNKYGDYLAIQNATAAARKTEGVYTSEQLLEGANRVGGQSRIAEGVAPMQKRAGGGLGIAKSQADELTSMKKTGEANIKATETKAAEKIKSIGTQQEAKASALRKSVETRAGAIKKTATGKFSEYENAVNAVDDVFKNKKTPAAQTQQLVKAAKKDKTGKSIAGLKAAYIKNFASRIDDHGKLSRDAIKKFDELEDAMRPLFGKGEMKNLRDAVRESEKIYKHMGVNPAVLPEATKGALFYAAVVFGAQTGAKVTSNPLMAASLGRELSTKFVSKGPHGKVVKVMEDLMLNPQNYLDEIAKVKAKPTKKNINTLLNKVPAISGSLKGDE